jgi:hypothetical protein
VPAKLTDIATPVKETPRLTQQLYAYCDPLQYGPVTGKLIVARMLPVAFGPDQTTTVPGSFAAA